MRARLTTHGNSTLIATDWEVTIYPLSEGTYCAHLAKFTGTAGVQVSQILFKYLLGTGVCS